MEKRVENPVQDKHSKSIDDPKQNNNSFKTKLQKSKAKLLGSYYGNPIKDMRLICITGSTGKATVAHFLHEILRAASQHVAILASDTEIRAGMLHKFFADAWKAGANYVIVTAPADSLKKNVFYGLPVYAAALTDFLDPSLTTPTPEEFFADSTTLFKMSPEIVVLNADDIYYSNFAEYTGKQQTLTYGRNSLSDLRIESSTLYKKGIEATFSLGSNYFTVASFLTGEPIVSYMACATAIAITLHIDASVIAEGLANYNPEESE